LSDIDKKREYDSERKYRAPQDSDDERIRRVVIRNIEDEFSDWNITATEIESLARNNPDISSTGQKLGI
jgi:hypothetical protein